MVNDTVTERGRADQPLLGLVDVEIEVRPRPVAMDAQLVLKLQEMIRHLMLEAGGAFPAPFAERRLAIGLQKILPGTDRDEGCTGF